MRRNILFGLSLALLAAGAAQARADTLIIEGLADERASADAKPRRGMTMDRVEAAYGAPSEQRPAVGEPPITRWEYPAFIVYFEHDRVIHTVARR